MKKGILEVCVLAVLKKQDSYGYKIIGDISNFIPISESTLYPILKRLETGNCLTTYSIAHNGRLRKYYKITPVGLRRIKDFLDDWREIMDIYQFILQEEKDDES
jgi:PadR family transcriptional regulator PadR